MPNHPKVVVTIQTVFDYTPEEVDQLLGTFRSKCLHSVFVECCFNPAKQQLVLEGDGKVMEFALRDVMIIIEQMTAEEGKKEKSEQMRRARPANLNNTSIRWIENSPSESLQQSACKYKVSNIVFAVFCRGVL